MREKEATTNVFLQVHPISTSPHSLSTQAAIPASRLNLSVNSETNSVTPSLSGSSEAISDALSSSNKEIIFSKVILSSQPQIPTLPLGVLLKGESIGLIVGGALESSSSSMTTGMSSSSLTGQTGATSNTSRPQNLKSLQEIITQLQLLVDNHLLSENEDSNATISLSYNVFGISDTSCVDLVNYSRITMEELSTLHPRNHERAMDLQYQLGSTLDSLIDLLNQGSSLPLVLVIRLIARPSDMEPATISHLLLADFGSIFLANHPLEASFSSLRSALIDVKEGLTDGGHSFDSNSADGNNFLKQQQSITNQNHPTFLSTILAPYLSFNNCKNDTLTGAHSFFWANLPSIGGSRVITKSLEFLETLSLLPLLQVSSCKESAELLELEALLLVHAELEGDYQNLKDDVVKLKKELFLSIKRKEELERKSSALEDESILVRLELEYQIANEEIVKIELQDRLRRMEINTIHMECEKNITLSKCVVMQERIEYLESSFSLSAKRENIIKDEALKEIGYFVSALQECNLRLTTLDSERQGLSRNLDHCQSVIRELERKGGNDRQQLQEQQQSSGECLRLQNEIVDLKRQLARLKQPVNNIGSGLGSDLERQIESLRLENDSLNNRLKRASASVNDANSSFGLHSSTLPKIPRTVASSNVRSSGAIKSSSKSAAPKAKMVAKKSDSYDPLMAFSMSVDKGDVDAGNTNVDDVDDDIEVPGTPPKKTNITDKWRPSAFVPKSLSQTLSSAGGIGLSGLSGLSNGSMGKDQHHSSRIKLPTRNDSSLTTAPTPQPRERKSVDPKAFQGIMSSFQMPSK